MYIRDDGGVEEDKGYTEGCVTITADSSLRLVKLNLNRDSLLKELQKEFPSIVRINFKVGTMY